MHMRYQRARFRAITLAINQFLASFECAFSDLSALIDIEMGNSNDVIISEWAQGEIDTPGLRGPEKIKRNWKLNRKSILYF